MKRGIGTISLLPFFLLLFMAGTSCSGDDRVLRASDGKDIAFSTMIDDVRQAQVLFVGETHNSKRDHEFQLSVIKALHRARVPLAIGLEMFRADSQQILDQWVKGNLGEREFLNAYDDNWGVSWHLYKAIFLFARDNGIPMVGLNVPADITRKVSLSGFSSLTQEELKRLPPGISCSVDERYMDFIRRAYAAHGVKDKSFVNFCEAQMVWDKAMAWHLAAYQKKNPGRMIVVLTGVGHAWKRGIPEQLQEMAKLRCRVILPEIPDRIDRTTMLSHDTDYILLK
ncbi:MAG: ChaN family lipoprotein [Nitrospirae bacterium]|nr:ChaN family lipoprotein [Nitrospirota bacterium]